jgi:hypothetical protein
MPLWRGCRPTGSPGRPTASWRSTYAITAARRIAQLIEEMAPDRVRDFDRLLKAQERESQWIASLATRMRLSQQSSYDKSKRKPVEPAEKPWEVR